MAIVREQRDEVAKSLAAFMRGEITDEEYFARGKEIARNIEASDDIDKFAAFNANALIWTSPKNKAVGTVAVNEEDWNKMRCRLAFLASDLEMKKAGEREQPKPGKWLIGLIVAMTALVATGYYYWRGINLGFFIATWAGLGVSTFFIFNMADKRVAERYRASLPKEPFHPFNDEAQFEQHRHLLQRFNLPTYDPAIHNVPVFNKRAWYERIGGFLGLVIIGSLFFTLVFVAIAIRGPFLIRNYFYRASGTTSRYVAVKASGEQA